MTQIALMESKPVVRSAIKNTVTGAAACFLTLLITHLLGVGYVHLFGPVFGDPNIPSLRIGFLIVVIAVAGTGLFYVVGDWILQLVETMRSNGT